MHGLVNHVKDFGLLISEYNAFKDLIQSLARLDLCFKMIPVARGCEMDFKGVGTPVIRASLVFLIEQENLE